MRIGLLLLVSLAAFTVGCGSNESHLVTPDKYLPPTTPTGAGSLAGKAAGSNGHAEKFIP